MKKALVTGYAEGVNSGTIKDLENGEMISFRREDIVGNVSPHGLVGKEVAFEKIDDESIKIFPISDEKDHNNSDKASKNFVRFRGYYTLNDAFAGFFSNLIWGLHALVVITLAWGLFDKDVLGSLGANEFFERLWIVLGLLVIYTAMVGILTTLVSINEHLREINRRQK